MNSSISVEDLLTLLYKWDKCASASVVVRLLPKTCHFGAALISSRLCYVSFAAPCSSAYPPATGCAPCPALQVSHDPVIIIRSIISVYGLCVKIEPHFPVDSTRIHPLQSSPDHIGRGIVSCEPKVNRPKNQWVRPAWLEPAFFFILPPDRFRSQRRAVPITRYYFLLPLITFLKNQMSQIRNFLWVSPLAGEIRLSVSGVCPFLSGPLIITLHNVKLLAHFFAAYCNNIFSVNSSHLFFFARGWL